MIEELSKNVSTTTPRCYRFTSELMRRIVVPFVLGVNLVNLKINFNSEILLSVELYFDYASRPQHIVFIERETILLNINTAPP